MVKLLQALLRWCFMRVENLFNLAFGDKLNPFYHLGTISFWQFWLLVGTGFYLYIFADTGVHNAFESVEAITHDQWWAGGIMRSIHRYATDGMILTMILHLIRHFAYDRYRGFRAFSWITGVVLLILVYVAGINGFMLVWDQLAQFIVIAIAEWFDVLPMFNGTVIRNFLYEVCGATGDWTMGDYKNTAIAAVREKVGSGRVLLALSGGVDSSVVAALLAEAVGPQLTCVFVDHGLMRLNEGDEVEAAFKKWDINFVRVNAEGRFLSKLAGISDPERKRKIIGEEFIRVFEEESKKIGAVDFLAQGTIYPDVIESGLGNAAVIQSHHNVGGLPDYVDFKEIIEPLRLLFKDEVRQLGRELGLPEYLVSRQPFPGPGLAIRIMGEITKEKADTLRLADAIYREELEKAGENKKMNQYFAVLTDTRTVGVMGDGRSYDRVLALRAVTTEDFMTADWARIPYELLDKISGRIVNEVKGINRIVYDITSKPPATVEWE